MSTLPGALIADASVAVKLFLPEPLADNAVRVFSLLGAEKPGRIFVPDLFYAECANVLWKSARRLGIPDAAVVANLEELTAMGLECVPSMVLAVPALVLALEHDISAYDAIYLAASDKLRLPLVTADEKLVKKLKKKRHDIRWLGDV